LEALSHHTEEKNAYLALSSVIINKQINDNNNTSFLYFNNGSKFVAFLYIFYLKKEEVGTIFGSTLFSEHCVVVCMCARARFDSETAYFRLRN